jgi:hypothetical protein
MLMWSSLLTALFVFFIWRKLIDGYTVCILVASTSREIFSSSHFRDIHESKDKISRTNIECQVLVVYVPLDGKNQIVTLLQRQINTFTKVTLVNFFQNDYSCLLSSNWGFVLSTSSDPWPPTNNDLIAKGAKESHKANRIPHGVTIAQVMYVQAYSTTMGNQHQSDFQRTSSG